MRMVDIVLIICTTITGGCVRPSHGEKGPATPSRGSPQEMVAEGIENGRTVTLKIKDISITSANLRVDYSLENAFPHEIWAGDPLNVNTPLRKPAVETRISDGALHIDFRFDIPSRINMDTIFAAYRRLRPGESRCGTVLLDLPIIDNSFENFSMGIPRDEEEDAVAHRVVFEIGYFKGDLSTALSESLKDSNAWQPKSDDPNVAFVPHWWKDLDLEQSAQVLIDNVSLPVRVLRPAR